MGVAKANDAMMNSNGRGFIFGGEGEHHQEKLTGSGRLSWA
jgi:hypothetical protein